MLSILKAVAQYENIGLEDADKLLSSVLPNTHPAAMLPAPTPAAPSVNWSSIIRGIIASSGKYAVNKDIRQWLSAFVSNVELSSGATISSLPYGQVVKLLVQCVEPGIQVFVNGLKSASTFKQLQDELFNKYGKSLRQVQF